MRAGLGARNACNRRASCQFAKRTVPRHTYSHSRAFGTYDQRNVRITACTAARSHSLQQVGQQQQQFSRQQWDQQAPALLSRLGLPGVHSPTQLWQCLGEFPDSQQQTLQKALDVESCRLLLAAAHVTCHTQQQYNQLQPLINAATVQFPAFGLADFHLLLQLCSKACYIPDKEWLAAAMYANTGGFERFYKEAPAADVVAMLYELSAVFASHKQLVLQIRQHVIEQQQQQQEQVGAQTAASGVGASGHAAAAADATSDTAAELTALQTALQTATQNLSSILQDPLLAGELSALGGYLLIQKLLPQLQHDLATVLRGLTALPGLSYQVLDSDDADLLLSLLISHLEGWDCSQLAAALTSALPCLCETAPTHGQHLALLFAAAGAAAAGMGDDEAGQVLVVLSRLPGYAPAPEVAQVLLDRALQPPLELHPSKLYQLLKAAEELGALPRQQHLEVIQQALSRA